ncbi:hypothetical protein WJX77_000312 [Trebouxia sp. C0004]
MWAVQPADGLTVGLEDQSATGAAFRLFNANSTQAYGPAGPIGATGPVGLVGPTGPQGLQGPKGCRVWSVHKVPLAHKECRETMQRKKRCSSVSTSGGLSKSPAVTILSSRMVFVKAQDLIASDIGLRSLNKLKHKKHRKSTRHIKSYSVHGVRLGV